jgi:hypothetical protein
MQLSTQRRAALASAFLLFCLSEAGVAHARMAGFGATILRHTYKGLRGFRKPRMLIEDILVEAAGENNLVPLASPNSASKELPADYRRHGPGFWV